MAVTRTEVYYVPENSQEARLTKGIIFGETVSVRTVMTQVGLPSPHAAMQFLRKLEDKGVITISSN
jgi:SOS-response transcriptional repressor LexA